MHFRSRVAAKSAAALRDCWLEKTFREIISSSRQAKVFQYLSRIVTVKQLGLGILVLKKTLDPRTLVDSDTRFLANLSSQLLYYAMYNHNTKKRKLFYQTQGVDFMVGMDCWRTRDGWKRNSSFEPFTHVCPLWDIFFPLLLSLIGHVLVILKCLMPLLVRVLLMMMLNMEEPTTRGACIWVGAWLE